MEVDPLGAFINGLMFGAGFALSFLTAAFACYLWWKAGHELET